MSKDFVQIADDVISGVRLLREGAPDLMKAFGAFATAATTSKAIDTIRIKCDCGAALADLPPVVDMPRFPGANEPCRKHAFAITLGYLTT